MDTLIHADIFFFVTTIIFIVLGLGVSIALLYLIKILRDISQVTEKVKLESDEIIQDIKHIRGSIKAQGLQFGFVKQLAKTLFGMRKKIKKTEQ